ncbi:hypothetical protein KFL_002320170 [Klebsormidium nitens]|uniref:YHYH domain-containing protein n=1 Tax=Klebsormidium nitens TaxID=105231 RepID=A0A1Y1I4F9_KLENI|nr:hypothetical protein KFL_002320170 [Klebsormidium nitens]|eukprot:GAQ85383.1 hypothetical protein KFL_002320170 [Klebsormidium nitens]
MSCFPQSGKTYPGSRLASRTVSVAGGVNIPATALLAVTGVMALPRVLRLLATVFTTILFLSIGAMAQCPPGAPGCPTFPPNNNPDCGTDRGAAVVTYSVTDTLRTIFSNGCPPYDWNGSKSPGPPGPNGTAEFAHAKQSQISFNIPRRPRIQADIGDALRLETVKGPVGQTLFGPPLFSPFDIMGRDALVFEGATFDSCGGHVAPGPDQYHYHSTPGDGAATRHRDSRNLDFDVCDQLNFWMQPDRRWWHSPLFGVMADGVPIYGPRGDWGQLPKNLDDCQGHKDTTHPYYHYHTTSNFPYLTTCLRGCMDPNIQRGRNWQGVNFPACNPGSDQAPYYWLDLEIPGLLSLFQYGGNNRKLK